MIFDDVINNAYKWTKSFHLNHFSDGNLDAIYDVTIAYPDNLPEREEDLKKGKLPKEVHFYIKRYFLWYI